MCGSYSTTNVLFYYYYYYVTCVTTSEFLPILLFVCYTSQAKKRQLIPIRNVVIRSLHASFPNPKTEYSLNVFALNLSTVTHSPFMPYPARPDKGRIGRK